jgi:hypothetical protein
MDIAISRNGVPIRIPEERWFHIVENHDDLAGHYDDVLETIENPDFILRAHGGALIALKGVARKTYLAVIYKELTRDDGFVITAYFTSRIARRLILWRQDRA